MADESMTQEERKEPKEPRQLSRRRFLFGSGMVVGGAVVATVAGPTLAPAAVEADGSATTLATTQTLPTTQVGGKQVPVAPAIGHIVVDPKYCSECRTCEMACSMAHGNTVNPKLAGIRIVRDELASVLAVPITCQQCAAASCMAACPTGALHLDPTTNAKVIDQSMCIGCQSCLRACVFEGQSRITYNPTTQKAFKCDLCGGDPQCVSMCTTFAATFEKGAN